MVHTKACAIHVGGVFFSLSLPTVSGGSWHFKIVNNHNAPHIVHELIHSRKQNVDIFMLRKYRSASQIESADLELLS